MATLVKQAWSQGDVQAYVQQLRENPIGLVWPLLGAYATYLVFTAIYNLTLHPLAKFPGPFFCRISNLPQCYYEAILNGKFMPEIDKYHEKYGSFVPFPHVEHRLTIIQAPWFESTQMRSISKTLLCTMRMCAPQVVEIGTDVNMPASVYKNNAFTKDPGSYALGVSQGMAFTISIEQHKAKRKTLNPCFAKLCINNMEDKLYDELDLVFAKIREYESRGEEVPIAELLYCYTVSPRTF